MIASTPTEMPFSSPEPQRREGVVRELLHPFSLQEAVTGVPAADTFIHALLLGCGLAGSRMSWKPGPKVPPQVGKSSVAVVFPDNILPWWLAQNFAFPVEFQAQIKSAMKHQFLRQPSPAEIRMAKEKEKMLRNWMPDQMRKFMGRSKRPSATNVDFLTNVPARGWFKQEPASFFGDDRVLLARGSADYRRLWKNRERPPFLLEMESGGGGWPRMAIHGWSSRNALLKVIRQMDALSVSLVGWLLPFHPGSPQPGDGRGRIETIDGFFRSVLLRRVGKEAYKFSPSPEVAERLHEASADLKKLVLRQPAHHHRMALHEDQLVWHFASLLTMVANHDSRPLHNDDIEHVVNLAAATAGRTVANHLNVLRQAFPVRDRNDTLSPAIVDRLVRMPMTIRDLTRSFHKIAASDIEGRLRRMAESGLVTPVANGRWAFVPIPLPDLSAELSETAMVQG